jgi:predicted nucleotidyltransferase
MTATVHVPDPAWESWLRCHPLPGAALFGSRTIAEVLGLLTMQISRPFAVRDLVFQLGTNLESTQRAMERLCAAQVVSEARAGRRREFRMPPGPRALALRQLVLDTVTLGPRLRWASGELGEDAVVSAFVHGSIATGTEGAQSDVDVIVVGTAAAPDLAPYLADLDHLLDRPVNALTVPPDAYVTGMAAPAGFLRRVADRPRLLVGVGDGRLAELEAHADRAA